MTKHGKEADKSGLHLCQTGGRRQRGQWQQLTWGEGHPEAATPLAPCHPPLTQAASDCSVPGPALGVSANKCNAQDVARSVLGTMGT